MSKDFAFRESCSNIKLKRILLNRK